MKIRKLKKLLYRICCEGYADWIPWFCDEEGDRYTVNHIYVDDDDDICLESTDMEGDGCYDFTTANILHRLTNYDPNSYVYFLEEFEDGDTYACDISDNWYTDYDVDEDDEILFIDVFGINDDDDDDDDDDNKEFSTCECPKCGYTCIDYYYNWDSYMFECKCPNCGFKYVAK